MCSKFHCIAPFLILADFAALNDDTKEGAGVSNNDVELQNVHAFNNTCLAILAHQNTQELGEGKVCPFIQNVTRVLLTYSLCFQNLLRPKSHSFGLEMTEN